MLLKSLAIIIACLGSVYVQAQDIDVQHYRFEVELSNTSDAIQGGATVSVKFLKPASELVLDLTSGNEEKGMYVFEVTEGATKLTSRQQGEQLFITLKAAAREGETRTFLIRYMGTPKDGLIISKNKFGQRTFFSDHWPNRAHNWLPTHDVPGDKATFEFIVTAPEEFQVISNGIKVEEKVVAKGLKRTHWKEDTPLSTKIMAIGVAKFAVRNYNEKPGGIPVSAWVYPQDSAALFYDYAVAPTALAFFSSYIAPFPFHKLANVQSTTMFGGMENAGAIFYSEELVSGKRKSEDVIAHEIAHQWFGDAVSEKDFSHLWLSEGFASYGSNMYMESRYGTDTLRARLRSDREKVRNFAASSDHPVIENTADLMSLLNANSYQKGEWILHMLRRQVGDTTFRKILQTFYLRNKGGNADSKDFETLASQVAGKDLSAFFNQWLRQPGIPTLDVKTKIEGSEVKVKLEQRKGDFQFPVEIGIYTSDGKMELHTVQMNGKEASLEVNVAGAKRVVIDPNVNLLFAFAK